MPFPVAAEVHDAEVTASTENGLEPTSAVGYAAFLAGEELEFERIDDSTYAIALPLPNPAVVANTLCYVLIGDDGAAHLVDPGWGTDANHARLRAALARLGIERVATVVATHFHDDHLGMASRIRDEFGARVLLGAGEAAVMNDWPPDFGAPWRLDEWGVPIARRPVLPARELGRARGMQLDGLLEDGDRLDLGRPIRVVRTPGHTQGSISLVDAERGRIFTGDHVLPEVNPGLGLGYLPERDPIGDYFESLERLLEWDGYEVLPGHGYRFARLGLRVGQLLQHHLRRSREVAAALEADPEARIWDIAATLTWTHGWDRLEGFYLLSALQQTAQHVRFVRDSARSARWLSLRG